MKSRVLNSGEITHFTLGLLALSLRSSAINISDEVDPFTPLVNNLLFYPGSTMNGAAPLLPHCYTPAQIQKKDNASMSMSVASAPLTKVGMSPLLGPENTLCECPFCNASVKTAVQYSTTSRTHMAAALWCLACFLCCIPYGSDSAKNADHYCPSCHRYLGTYEK